MPAPRRQPETPTDPLPGPRRADGPGADGVPGPVPALASVPPVAPGTPGDPGPRSGDTAGALLDAAEQLFSEKGYAAVGIREIVERAGANVAAISYHFGSKRELYLATVRRAMQRRRASRAWQVLQRRPAGPEEAAIVLAQFARRFLHRLLRPDDAGVSSRLILREAAEPSEAIDDVVREYIEPNEAVLVQVIAVIVPDATPGDLALLAQSTLGQILHYRVFRPFLERMSVGDLTAGARIDEVAAHVARFSLRALGCDEALIGRALDEAGRREQATEGEPENQSARARDGEPLEQSEPTR